MTTTAVEEAADEIRRLRGALGDERQRGHDLAQQLAEATSEKGALLEQLRRLDSLLQAKGPVDRLTERWLFEHHTRLEFKRTIHGDRVIASPRGRGQVVATTLDECLSILARRHGPPKA